MFQDFYSTEQSPIIFQGQSIQEWHQDLILEEQNLKKLLPYQDKTNLVLGKITVFPEDSDIPSIEINLNYFASLTQKIGYT